MNNSRNLLLAFALSALLIFGWDIGMGYFYPQPEKPVVTAASAPGGDTAPTSRASGTATVSSGNALAGTEDGLAPTGPLELDAALATPDRVVIKAPRIAGSINLVGARIDDVVLTDYRETTQKDSGPVRLFAPERTNVQHFAQLGFVVDGRQIPASAVWEADGEQLPPETPVTLSYTDEAERTFKIRLTVDENYMLAAEQVVENGSENAAIVQPFALIKRTSVNATPGQWIAHAGPTGVFADALHDPNYYEDLAEAGSDYPAGEASWLGFTDNYWVSALIPGEGVTDKAGWRSLGDNLFNAGVTYETQTLPAGGTLTQTTQLFAGAKESVVLDQYEATGITLFGKAISWGWFEWFEKPLLWLLRTLNGLIGNFGVAIIGLTLIIRALLFPIAQKGFASMASMKAVQPKMKEIQERHKDDKQLQQQKIMQLYKDEKVNPLSGCLPMLIQIPIFFALYKVLILAIEMRHEPFLYIRDLSAPDPATLLNLFGLLPFEVTGFLGIGVLAVLLGVTMWLTFKLNPSAMDPMQQQIFNLMPWFLMFVMAPFAAGLLIYWVTSNILTLAQQKYLYSQHPQLKAAAEKEKAEMAQKAEREKAEKSKA